MKALIVTILFLIIFSNQSYSQQPRLDSVFHRTITVLDSVANGKKHANTLKWEEIIFYFIISEWSGTNSTLTANETSQLGLTGIPPIKKKEIIAFKKWYRENSRKISEQDYFYSLGLYQKIDFSESDIQKLDSISSKYKKISK